MKHLVIILALTLAVGIACGGKVAVADCHGDVLCTGGPAGDYCCPSSNPYCGEPNTNCPVGDCCTNPPR